MEVAKTKRKINQKAINEFLLLLDLFLKTNASDKELSEKTGISSSTVGRRLVDEELMGMAFPSKSDEEIHEMYLKIKELRQRNLAQAKVLGGQNSILNNVFLKDEIGKFSGSSKLNLQIFSKNKDYQNKILWHIAHTFSLHPDTLGHLFGMDSSKIRQILIETRPEFTRAHEFLCQYDITNQEIAKKEFIDFYYQFLTAVKNNDARHKKELLNYLTDADYITLKKQRVGVNPYDITINELKTMLRHHLKYALTYRSIETYYGINRYAYRSFLEKYLKEENNETLKQRYNALSSYNFDFRGDFNVRRF